MGGAALRVGALQDAEVIELLNREFVPVWINVRVSPVPRFPDREEVLMTGRLDERDFIKDLGSKGFFLRVVVLHPDDLALLNRQAPTAEASVATFLREGHFAYAQAEAVDVLEMLRAAGREAAARGLSGGTRLSARAASDPGYAPPSR